MRCGYLTDRRSSIEYHINRKLSCIVEERPIKKDKIKELEERIEKLEKLLQKKDETL
jgi:polyhydroxyalkanoate synthesis regulator phasin